MSTLNPEQQTAVDSSSRDILVIAGAGTGKTKTLVARAERLVLSGVEPARILMLTFTKRAGEEMRHRMRMVLGDKAGEISIGTFHAWASGWLRRHPREFGRSPFKIATGDIAAEFMDLARDAIVENTRDQLEIVVNQRMRILTSSSNGEQVGEDEAKRRLALLDALPKNSDITSYWGFYRNTAESRDQDFRAYLLDRRWVTDDFQARVLQSITDKYQEEKIGQNYMDYDDMLAVFLNGIRVDDAPIRAAVRGSYDHVLVDELQDTSPLQWLILEQLRNPAHLFAVGDDCQAIYAFRGADFRNVHDFQARLPAAQILKLTRNYRSTQEILDVSNWLLDQSEVNYDKHLVAERGLGRRPRACSFHNEFEEADYVCEAIRTHAANGGRLSDIMVMGRSGNDLRHLENLLLKNKVPYIFVGGTSFLETRHIRDVLCLCLILDDLKDRLAWRRFLKMFPGVGSKTATFATDAMVRAPDLPSAVDQLRRMGKEGLNQAATILRQMPLAEQPGPLVAEARKALAGLMQKEYQDWAKRNQDLELLETMARQHRSVLGFLETYTLETVHGSQLEHKDRDHVVLITVHSAKGTEAPSVFILNATRLPHGRAKTTDEVEEERRILYVAITRAQDSLEICSSQEPVDGWFLETLPPELV